MCTRGGPDITARRTREDFRVLLVQLSSGFVEYSLIATVRRDEHDHAEPMRDQAPSDVQRDVAQGLWWHRERP